MHVARTAEPTPDYITEFPTIFAESTYQELPPHRSWDHEIDLIPGEHRLADKPYSLTHDERKALDEWLDENLQTG